MRVAVCAALAVVAALGVTACGGDDQAGRSTGEQVFDDASCGSCHTLAAAGSESNVGPDLDARRYSTAEVEKAVRAGGNGMPLYEGALTDAEIRAVSRFVARNGAARNG